MEHPNEPLAFSVIKFCERHGFSRAHFYNLPLDQRPRTMKVGGRTLISVEAAAAWRKAMETT